MMLHASIDAAYASGGRFFLGQKFCFRSYTIIMLGQMYPLIFIGPRSPGPIYVSGSLSQTKRPSVNLTDVTLADKETNLILSQW